MRTGFVTSTDYLDHVTAPGHPERVERLQAILAMMESSGLNRQVTAIVPRPATEAEICRLHDREYLRRLEGACVKGKHHIDCADSSICEDTYRTALLAAGAALVAADAIYDGSIDNAFCAVRPPGHHAERDRSMGFCMFGNVAIAAKYIQDRHGAKRVLIYDWDVHHGNGTQHLLEDDPSVFFCSFHQHPDTLYPGTGYAHETGRGAGEGFTLNVTFRPGDGDDEYIRAFDDVFLPAARKFKPDFVLVSAGYDAHKRDPLAHIELSERGFAHLARGVKQLAAESCGGKLICLLEGGYDLTALAANVKQTVEILREG